MVVVGGGFELVAAGLEQPLMSIIRATEAIAAAFMALSIFLPP
jgi:hypothetical protein